MRKTLLLAALTMLISAGAAASIAGELRQQSFPPGTQDARSASPLRLINHKRRECASTYHRLPGLCQRVFQNCVQESGDRNSCLGLLTYCNQCNDYFLDCIDKVGHDANYDCEFCQSNLKECQANFLD